MTTARDVRDAETLCQRKALEAAETAKQLLDNAPPRACDRAAHEHAIGLVNGWLKIAQAWFDIARAHDDYAVELEQKGAAA